MLRKRGKVWWAEFELHGQRVHRSTRCRAKGDAQLVEERWRREITLQHEGVPTSADISVGDLFLAWEEWARVHVSEDHRERVARDWRLHILPMLEYRLARTITSGDAEGIRTAFLSSPSQRNAHYGRAAGTPRTVSSANKLSRHLHLVFAWAVHPAGILSTVPFRVHLTRPKDTPHHFLVLEQVPAFLRAVDAPGNVHHSVAVRLMLLLGLREREALQLRWEAFGPGLASVNPAGKTGNAPPLPVPEDLQVWLRRLGPKPEGLVLPAADGQPHRQQFTVRAVQRGAAAVGIRITPHGLRGSLATMVARAGGGAHLVQKILRHDQLATSQRYVALVISDVEAMQDQLFPNAPPKSRQLAKRYAVNIRKMAGYKNGAKSS
jgi:integrase